jgi:hypothetical protein
MYPKECEAIIFALRAHPPAGLHLSYYEELHVPRLVSEHGSFCPIGTHPRSTIPCPQVEEAMRDFPEFSDTEIDTFMEWWDDLTLDQAREAAKEIWPDWSPV